MSNVIPRLIAVAFLMLFDGCGSVHASYREPLDHKMSDSLGVAKLHQLDSAATVADHADELVKLWDPDAVRIQPGSPVEIGRDRIYADDKRAENRDGSGKTLCYRSEIKDIQITGDWAFEWGYFAYRERAGRAGRGKVLRVMHRQPDGSWKFSRVIGFPDDSVPIAECS